MKLISNSIHLAVFTVGALFLLLTPGSLSAQIQVSPADTGILKWGYIYDSTYSVPSMCDRAGIVYYRISQRTHRRPVTAAEILDTVEMPMMVSKEGQDFVRSCLKKFDIDTLGIADLWGYARAALHIGDRFSFSRFAGKAHRARRYAALHPDSNRTI